MRKNLKTDFEKMTEEGQKKKIIRVFKNFLFCLQNIKMLIGNLPITYFGKYSLKIII